MNSLNIITAHVKGQTPPHSPTFPRSRSHSNSNTDAHHLASSTQRSSSSSPRRISDSLKQEKGQLGENVNNSLIQKEKSLEIHESVDEKTPLLSEQNHAPATAPGNSLWLLAKRLVDALAESLAWLLSAIKAPGIYLASCFKDERGNLSPFVPARRISRSFLRHRGKKSTAQAVGLSATNTDEKMALRNPSEHKSINRKPSFQGGSISDSSAPSISESDIERRHTLAPEIDTPPSYNTRSKTQKAAATTEEIAPAKKSIRIKLHSDAALKRKKQKQNSSDSLKPGDGTSSLSEAAAAALKSPSSPFSSLRLTRYPHAPAPPRPLIPRRQPSYSAATPHSRLQQKTLVIDLDETLIHSLAKGGRMSSGHMVEVKLNTPVGLGGGAVLGPQHPILYYVHKRPHCDHFLRKVSKWYNLVVFTASVQEYADPVIDWLEQEKKYFTARYYRQHCTYRNGAYIKDLSFIEPNLSKVMILDNSPMSYIFHEDNAIPIEGWINDPTDNDLLHLIPFLEALQYVMDVRALLALRRGEAEA
ncbi:MAG: Nuclear envelope morphology protein 1 [Cirrosporium novae-zelandiae]|nr:MAG: Nuclear envelope morphology protein 1 [Cirrosporium novae-zelandiae]